jgi:Putative prokaryotic signal transducing protein
MHIDPEDIAAGYANMGELELLELARSYDSLTDSAQAALRAEFARRNLEPPLIEDPEDRADSRTLVTLRRYRDLSEAIVARSLLESAGIYVFLRDENLVRLDWQVSNFIGGIRLQVEAQDEEAAIDLLRQSIPASIPFGGQNDFLQPHCPKCGSTDITFEGSSRGAALASLSVLSLPLPLGHETWLCNSCESRWEDTEDESV